MELFAAIGIFLMIATAVYAAAKKGIKVLGSSKYIPDRLGEDPGTVILDREFNDKLERYTLKRGEGTERMGVLYGERHGKEYVAEAFKNYRGKTVDLGPGKGARFEVSSGEPKAPEGMQAIGYVHGHRLRATPENKLPEDLKDDWKSSTRVQRRLFPSKEDLAWLKPGEVMLITSPRGDYRSWSIDEQGSAYSPGLAVRHEVKADNREIRAEKPFHRRAAAEA